MAQDKLRRRRWLCVDGILGMQFHGGKDVLEPRTVIGSDGRWVVAGFRELDQVAMARGGHGDDVAPVRADHAADTVDRDRLG